MARIDIKTNVVAPCEISVNLVREDHVYAKTGNTFRLLFEICLSMFSIISGAILAMWNDESSHKIPSIEYIFWGVTLAGCIAFYSLSASHLEKSKEKAAAS